MKNLTLPSNQLYLSFVEDILLNEKFLSMSSYIQHGNTSCLEHSINVSYMAFQLCEKKGLDSRAAARVGLLHDLFLYDWHDKTRGPKRYYHGFTHPKEALNNANREFSLSEKEKDGILRHMWPLTIIPPKFKEGFIVLWCDKKCSLFETFGIKIWR